MNNIELNQDVTKDAEAQSRLTDVLSTEEKLIVKRALDLYSRTEMTGYRNYAEEDVFDSVKRKLCIGG